MAQRHHRRQSKSNGRLCENEPRQPNQNANRAHRISATRLLAEYGRSLSATLRRQQSHCFEPTATTRTPHQHRRCRPARTSAVPSNQQRHRRQNQRDGHHPQTRRKWPHRSSAGLGSHKPRSGIAKQHSQQCSKPIQSDRETAQRADRATQ